MEAFRTYAPRARRRSALTLALIFTAAAASEVLAQPPLTTPDDFVAAAAGADQYEIMAAHVALIESHDPAVRTFATQMVRDHSAAFRALSQAALSSGLKPPSTSVGADEAPLLAALQGVGPDAFDRTYVRQQVLAHVQALTTERDYARQGSDANLRQAAQADVPMIEQHLQIATDLRRSKGG